MLMAFLIAGPRVHQLLCPRFARVKYVSVFVEIR